VNPGGPELARDLERLLAIKDDSQYGVLDVTVQRADTAVRYARRLVDAAARHVHGEA
jgi:hypothetical protein